MKTILTVQASARKTRSITRELARIFLDTFNVVDSTARIIMRDLLDHPPPFVTEDWIAAAFSRTPDQLDEHQRAVLAASDELIAEVKAADVIVLATPMYNYGMPAALKAWFDQVIRINQTFSFDLARGDQPIEPTLHGKTLVILSARGEGYFGAGERNAPMNHLETHIDSVKHFLGADAPSHLIHVDFQEFGDERHEQSKAAATQQAEDLARQLAAR